MALKLSNSIPELLRCRILVVVCELVMVRSFAPLSILPGQTDTSTSSADTPIQARNWRIKIYASFTC